LTDQPSVSSGPAAPSIIIAAFGAPTAGANPGPNTGTMTTQRKILLTKIL